ncbi:small-conductance mechanosensitive channel [Desulfobaculum xiamenense]|uniref:Small-conductance mechanosensitive channel n=1 Tax=Desulfobaculum xiamenense TaxID=995050 RepID=A0A846QMG9_9BACT|nr:hypothetical protein [Desulfobaculum xiamenense]NJB69301.1 small-conductance mechanosensitive channel [Desulfobaculum xiamenense]
MNISNGTLDTALRMGATPRLETGRNRAEGAGSEDHGDTVDISPEARKLAEEAGQGKGASVNMAQAAGKDEASSQDAVEQLIKSLKQQIERVKQEIQQLEEGDMDPEQKQKMLAAKRSELASLQEQLNKVMQEKTETSGGSSAGASFMKRGSLT